MDATDYVFLGTETVFGCFHSVVSHLISREISSTAQLYLSRYYGLGPVNCILLGFDIYRDPEHWVGSVSGFAAGMYAQAKIGALIGGSIGGVPGVIIGCIAGAIVGFCVTKFINKMQDDYKTGSGIFSPRSPGGGGGPGGVEFRKVTPIEGFTEANIILLRRSNIFFETEDEKLTREAFNSLCHPQFQNRKIQEYFHTIVSEIFEGKYYGENIPFVSLHFNQQGLLYSVMNPIYKNTIIGNALAYLDFFLKGFVNGGFFDVKFVKNWKYTPSVNLDELNKSLLDIRMILKKIKPGYRSLYSLLDQDNYGNEFSSAFRIIGIISSTCKISGENIFPSSQFIVETDINPNPSFKKIIASDEKAQAKWMKIQNAHNLMKFYILEYMPLIPQFKGYFQILKMICFALHYVESLDSVGLVAETNSSFRNQDQSYVDIIPEFFPPLPVRKSFKIDPKITYGDIFKSLIETPFDDELFMIMEGKLDEFSNKVFQLMVDKICVLYKNKVRVEILAQNLQEYIYDDDDLELDLFRLLIRIFVEQIQDFMPQVISNRYATVIKLAKNSLEQNNLRERLPEDVLQYFEIEELNLTIPQLRDRLQRITEKIKIVMDITSINQSFDKIYHHFSHIEVTDDIYFLFKDFLNNQFKFTLTISSPIIANDVNTSIRGGCLIHTAQPCTIINRELPLHDIRSIETNVQKGNDYIEIQRKGGFLTSFNLLPYRYSTIELNKKIINDDFIKLLKKYGITTKHLCLMNSVIGKPISDLPLNKLNSKTVNNVYGINMPCVEGNIQVIDFFIKKGQDFGKTQYNGLYPFLEIVQNGNHRAAMHILTHPDAKITNINQSTETRITPLHWAIYYGWDDVVKQLISRKASTEITLRSNGMSPIHLACFQDQPQCLSVLMTAPDANYELSDAGYTPFHIAAAHSLNCAKLLIDNNASNSLIKDPYGHTARDIAILNGQYDIAKIIPETSQTIEFINNYEIQAKSQSFDFSALLEAFSTGDLSTTKKVLNKFIERNQGKKLNQGYYEQLIDSACKGRCTEYVEFLSTILPLDQCPIAIKTAQYGIINWLNELKKYGANFTIQNYGFLDEAIDNGDDEFLKEALYVVDKIPEHVWRRIVKKSIMIDDDKIMIKLKECLNSNEKYSNIHLAAEDIITPKTNLKSFLYFVDFVNPESLEMLNQFIDYISLQFLQELIRYRSFNNVQLTTSVLRAIQKKRFDIAYIILLEFPAVQVELFEKGYNQILNKITNENFILAQNQIGKLLNTNESNVKALKTILNQTFDLGMLKVYDDKSLLELAGIDYKYLWILNILPDQFVSEFTFNISYSFEIQCTSTFSTVFNLFKNKFGKYAGSLFLRTFRELDFEVIDEIGSGDDFVSNLIKVMIENNINKNAYIKSIDDEKQTLFHITAKFSNIIESNLNKIMKNIREASRTWNDLLNIKNRKGETILMVYASKANFKAIQMLENMGADMKTRDTFGNNILHKILKYKSKQNDQLIEGITEIAKKHRDLILQYNRKGQNVFYCAAKRGFNGILGVFSIFYPVEVLDNLNENCMYSALHCAAEKNYYETVRYLVQNLHLDLNVRTFDFFHLAPIHKAAITSSFETFKEIVKLGGNPLIEDSLGNNAFYYAFRFGSDFMVNEMMNFSSFAFELSSPTILIPIVQNKQAVSIFPLICGLIDPSASRKCDFQGMTLLSLAAESDNRKIVNELLLMGVDPAKPANNGQNSIHICAEKSNIGCSTLILKYILLTKGVDEISRILNSPDKKGNLPIHIAAQKGYTGFLVHLLSSCNEINIDKDNYDGYNSVYLAQKNGHTKAAAILENYWICKKYGPGSNELPPSIPFYISKVFAESYKIIEEIPNISNEYDPIDNIDMQNQNIQNSFASIFMDEIEKRSIQIHPDVRSKFYRIFNNGNFDSKVLMLIKDGKKEFVKLMFEMMFYQKPNKINLIAYLMIFPRLTNDELEPFIGCISTLNSIKIPIKHPLFAWIENGLISAVELQSQSMPMMQNIDIVVQFAYRVFTNSRLRKVIKYPCLPLPVHIVARWLMNFKDSWLKVQLQFMDYTKITAFLEKKQMLGIDFCNRLDYNQYNLVNFIMDRSNNSIDHSKNFKEYVVHAIKATFDIYNDPEIQDNIRQNIINKCIELAQKQQFLPKSLTQWALLTRRIIKDFDVSCLIEYLKHIPQNSLDMANHALSLILNIGSPDQVSISLIKKGIDKLEEASKNAEKNKFVENRSLDEILNSFRKKDAPFIPYKFAFDGTPIIELSQKDRDNLRIFGNILELGVKLTGTLEESAKEAGLIFKHTPTVENAARLVAIVRFAIKDTLNLKPFIIQCLAVGALLLHRVNKSPDLKGRIAQIATGEGKSIIVAMLAACVALTGNFVDVISSSFYLAKRDAEKFDEFYDKLGLRCGTLDEDDQLPNVDYHVIYSTNTGFEFAFLREGISGKKTLIAVPFGCNITIPRAPMTAIVDEADNLFIDTVKNSARIASGSSSQQKWIFAPLYKEVNSRRFMSTFEARQFLNSIAKSDDERNSLNELSDYQLGRWINNAKNAKNLIKDVHYVVGFNQKDKKYEIQIVDHENTGRINLGSRWTEGLHEFVEVKEGLQVRSQSLTIAAVSHPSFFGRYKEIYGLTGTLGDQTERNEIGKMYGLDTFDVPPNRKCLRKRIETLIVHTDAQKHEIIINKIREIRSSQRPILVIVKSISESQEISNKLNNLGIKHYLLNDIQDEDEDFIVDRAGKSGSVTIATNTAGRGTDIRPEKLAIENGGLHVILAFLPINMRVECQGLGRAGRQGQPGSCQIIFSDTTFARENPVASDDVLKIVYDKLADDVANESRQRIEHTQREQRIFAILTQYFNYIFRLRQFLEGPQGEQLLNMFGGENLGNQFDSESILSNLSFKWSQFYTCLSNNEIEIKDDLFDRFKEKYEDDEKVLTLAFNDYLESGVSIGSSSIESSSIDGSYSDDTYSATHSIDADPAKSAIKEFSGAKPIQF